ncbi:thiamine pyrophosphate-binding protein [Paenarthrobacter aurescens]|uniref:Acetolactate synthase I/II/III large subunit n=1 Tax=Paenarthrobacter aurescens TaxID=43663 RepID=A0A4Y3NB96_PAEAU|nr:thiamine pyrophosphate-binding protein [Paenarthrobacter aurescens]MDO6141948.1 thiamine pyrophosphate-binding protein [Paenarthrobacter aurescens]MDO6145753.1 thiamine pyrophosphate-binding protein [Paenarthrobacter aurescens]MDO6156997.1 thiamine pyrophosphate-binding protein [Paenarthrobacter aurescens]MDO6160983.1 thiamine pyrophosphate-binding protein [Paenarthrobacter aurescens]GEB19160.1 acetolactate synthase I/II/III large subunit [Paenarthrobacter aurescens]
MSGQERVSALVGRTLAKLGVGHVFGVVGSGNFEVTGTLMAQGVPFTAARHEGGAATMADAYSRMSGKVGVVTTHQGCGLSNAITGIGEAAKSRTPMIVLTADTQAAAIRSNFKIDQDNLARSIGAVAERIHSPATAVADTLRAYRTAVNERRTVVLSLPLDIQHAPAPTAADEVSAVVVPEPLKIRPDAAAVEQLMALITAAERPVFVAGRGGRGARDEILELARHAGALVATSAVASGLFNGDSHNLGISGGFSSPVTAELISGADLIVGWGCALNMWTMRHGRLISTGTTVVQIDVEDSALGANRPITLGVLGDSALTAADALTALRSAQPEPAGKYRTENNALAIKQSSRWRDVHTEDLSTATSIDPRVLTRELDSLLPAERIVAVDSGNFMGYPSQYLAVPDEFGFCFTQAFQAIGLGLYTAIGAAVAQPQRLPVLGAGDGGFLMGISELETAVRLKLPLVCIVYNDAAYGAEVHHFAPEHTEAELASVVFPETDIAAIARGFGAAGVTVRTVGDLDAVRPWIASYEAGTQDRPLVIDAKIASDGGSWWLAEAFQGH